MSYVVLEILLPAFRDQNARKDIGFTITDAGKSRSKDPGFRIKCGMTQALLAEKRVIS